MVLHLLYANTLVKVWFLVWGFFFGFLLGEVSMPGLAEHP